MSSIINGFEGKGAKVSLKYFGLNDYATNWDINEMFENSTFIIKYFEDNNIGTLETVDNFFDYLYASKILKMEEVIPLIKSDKSKTAFKNLLSVVKVYFKKFEIGNVIKFINKNYCDLFDKKYRIHRLLDVTSELIKEYPGISDEVYLFLIEQHTYIVLDNYANFMKKIEKNEKLFSKLFEKERVIKVFDNRQETVQNIIISIVKRNKEKLTQRINDLTEELIIEEEKLVNVINTENVIQYSSQITSFYNFLKKLKHQKANDFKSHINNIENKIGLYLSKYGKEFSYNIPVGKIIEELNNIKPWYCKLIHISHSYSNGTIGSILNISSNGPRGLADLVSSNVNTDEYYTFTHIKNLNILMTVGAATWLGLLKNEVLFNESSDWFNGYIHIVCEKFNFEEVELKNDLMLLYQMLNNCKSIAASRNIQVERSVCYGTSMFICALIEKILRMIYVKLKREIDYVEIDKITLGDLLNDKNELMTKVFGCYELKHLRYFLLTDGENRIGKNYRNSLAHYSSIKLESINIVFVSELMFLFTDVVSSIFLYGSRRS